MINTNRNGGSFGYRSNGKIYFTKKEVITNNNNKSNTII